MTLVLVIIISAISLLAFSRQELLYKYQFNAYQIVRKKQWYRILSHGFLHANMEHLFVNMFVLYSFGSAVEDYFKVFGDKWLLYYLLLFFGGIVLSSVYSLIKHKDNYHYNAVGTSGAVSAVVFAAIFFDPWRKILFFFILPIPGIVFAGLYLAYSYYMSKRKMDNIGHDAHFWGAIYGLAFPIIVNPELFNFFINQLFKT
ncbi:rhomboid family intramembrane serine protease [Bacteroidota bacterium]